MEYSNSPDYLKSADLHNIGSESPSFFSDPIGKIEGIATGVVDVVKATPAFVQTSIASGINSIYNSGVVVGNFLGVTDAQENDLTQTLYGYDTNLGRYYEDHKQAVDITGFIATSFVPGTLGVKAVRGGQALLASSMKTGGVARTLAQSTGLIPTVNAAGESLTIVAGKALAQGQQTFRLLDAGVIKAIGSGFVQSTLESAGFEAMVAATMFKSPVLENQDFSDIASNILTGAVLGGAIGGLVHSASVVGGVKKVLAEADKSTNYLRARISQAGLESDPQARLKIIAHELATTPTVENLTDTSHTALRSERLGILEGEARLAINQLVKGDPELSKILGDSLISDPNQLLKSTQGAVRVNRLSGLDPDINLADGEVAMYVKLHGKGMGEVMEARPTTGLKLADMLPNSKEVDKTVASFGFKTGDVSYSIARVTGMNQIEARYIWAEQTAKYANGMRISENDIPLLEGALRNKLTEINVVSSEGVNIPHDYESLKELVETRKIALANDMAGSGWALKYRKGTEEEIAQAVNVHVDALHGDKSASLFARQTDQAEYNKLMLERGIKTPADLTYVPSHAAVAYDVTDLVNASSDAISAITNIKYAEKIQQQAVSRATAAVFEELRERVVHPTQEALAGANRNGAGAGIVSSANGAYGTLASDVEQMGKLTADLTTKLMKKTEAALESVVLRIRGNQEAAIEIDKLKNLMASTSEKYILDESGTRYISKAIADYMDKKANNIVGLIKPVLQVGAPETIEIRSPLAQEFLKINDSVNTGRRSLTNGMKVAMGAADDSSLGAHYPIKPDPKDFRFFAIVRDETITGKAMGHSSMIHATSETELQKMIDTIRGDGRFTTYKVSTKGEMESYFKQTQSYEFGETLHENYIDSSIRAMGVNNQFFPKTDANAIMDEWMRWHMKEDTKLARTTMSHEFANEFDQLTRLGKQYTNVASSKYASSVSAIEGTMKNPYNDYIKTALNISRVGEYPLISNVNNLLSSAVDGTIQKLVDAVKEVKTTNDLPKINAILESAGINHAYKNAAEVILANHAVPKPYLSKFIRDANSILAATFLKLDFFNPLNNAIGAQVLLGHETYGQTKNALRHVDVAGVTVPGTTDTILSPLKLIKKAQENFLSRDPKLGEWYKANGWDTSINDQVKSIIDDLTVSQTDNVSKLAWRSQSALEKMKTFSDFGGKITGNNLAERYNRFIAADVARQISDVKIANGLMGQGEQLAFINTFVNRTQANMLASQRPLIFQGPIGQAIGLFQSFQFNTMQQLFRGVAEGGAKDAAVLLGLQGTMYGLNGLPGFSYINQHIVGTASGNKNHTDAYSTLYGAAGKEAGDWLMYGIPSNLLQANLYSRGDINPRTLTVIPTSPGEVIAVSAFAKFAGNLKETVSKIAGGGDVWQSVLQGLEHNGLSRPLAGLAQTLQATQNPQGKVISTTNSGDLSFVNDFMSLATLSRLAGGKPLDEALANDEAQRAIVYKAKDKDRMSKANEIFKTHLMSPGETVEPTAVHDYMSAFVHNGGRAEDFNKQMMNLMTKTTTPKANKIIETLKGPYAEHMKSLMGGRVDTLE